jgi:hypothetical protein
MSERSLPLRKEDIVVVIPIYKTSLSRLEELSLKRCNDVLRDYSLVVVKPAGLDLSQWMPAYPSLHVEEFPAHYFASLRGYNKLVLAPIFYQRFSNYEYMLIHQLDAYVFRDELLEWSRKGYDYMGAPWLPFKRPKRIFRKSATMRIKYFIYRLINSPKAYKWKYHEYEVGNGGFSLRNIPKMVAITTRYNDRIERLTSDDAPFYPEDVLLATELDEKDFQLRTPSFMEALRFATEIGSDWVYENNGGQLPFGCHAWYQKEFYPFWSKIIDEHEYEKQ